MKKLLMLFSIVLIGITLTGCSLLPEDIQEISEEFCRDNPTNEICQGDLIDGLEDTAILDVFNVIVAEYNDETNETFCDDYFSVTNVELLDACRISREALLPLDFENYTVLGAEKKSTLSTENIYEIKTVSENGLIEVVFTVGVVNVDNVMYIDTWSFEVFEQDPETTAVSLEAARAYLEQFLLDYVDESISNEDFCLLYFPLNEYCIEDREYVLEDEIILSLGGIIALEDGLFELDLTMTMEGEDPESEKGYVILVYGPEGNIIMTITDDEYETPVIDFETAEQFVVDFIADFHDYTLTDEEVCNFYFNEFEADGCIGGRSEMLEEFATIELTDFYHNGTNYIAVFSFYIDSVFDSEAENAVFFNYNEFGELKISFEGGGGDETYYPELTYDDAYALLVNFLEEFVDTNISNEDFCERYNLSDYEGNCIFDRETLDLENSYPVIEYFDFYEYYAEVGLSIEVPESTSGELFYSLIVYYYYDNIGELHMEIFQGEYKTNYLEFDDAVAVLQQYILDVVNPDITVQYLNDLYFNNTEDMGGEAERLDAIANGFSVVFIEAIQIDIYADSYFELTVEVTMDGDTTIQTDLVRVELLDNGNYLIEFSYGTYEKEITYSEAYQFLSFFYEEFYWEGASSFDFCSLVFEGDEIQECITARDNPSEEDPFVIFIDIYNDYGMWEVELLLEFTDGHTETIYLPVHIYYNEEGMIKLHFVIDPYNEILEYEATTLIVQFYDDVFDETMSDEEYCDLYDYLFIDCISERELITSLGLVWVEDITSEGYNIYTVLIAGDNLFGAGYDETEIFVAVFVDEFGNLRLDFDNSSKPDPRDEFTYVDLATATMLYTWYIEDYFNPAISHDQLAEMYFLSYVDEFFAQQRDYDLANFDLALIEYILDPYAGNGADFLEASVIFQSASIDDYRIENFRFLSFADGTIFLEFEYYFVPNEEELLVLETVLETYYIDFNDESIASPAFCSLYHEGLILEECIMFRNEMLLTELDFDFVEIVPVDNGLYIIYIDIYELGIYSYNLEYEIYTYYDNNDLLSFDIFYYFYLEDEMFEELLWAFDDFIYIFGNDVIPSPEYCAMYSENPDGCIALRDELLSRGLVNVYPIDLFIDSYMGSEILYVAIVEYEFLDGTYETHTWALDVYYSVPGDYIYFDIYPIEDAIPEPIIGDLAGELLTEEIMIAFYADLADGSLTNEQICITYFNGLYDEMNCGQDRLDMIAENLTTTIISIAPYTTIPGDMAYIIEIEFTMDSYTFVSVEIMRVYMTTNNHVYIQFLNEDGTPLSPYLPGLAPLADIEDLYSSFVADFNNPTLSNTYMCETYSMLTDNFLKCNADRLTLLDAGYYFVFQGADLLNDPLHGDYYHVALVFTNETSNTFYNLSQYVFYGIGDTLFVNDVWEEYND